MTTTVSRAKPKNGATLIRIADLRKAGKTDMNTRFLLMAQYGAKAIIPIEDVARDYFSVTADKLARKIASGEIRIPLVRMDAGSQKAAKGVHIEDLAEWIDARRDAAKKELRQIID